ncbi:MAG: TIGR01777 family protein [Planctomycetes bacterium]|nr:TIGR01777 family protein [Planctomycetota bacterium]
MRRRVLILGGSGFVGSRIADLLVTRGDEVGIVTRNPDRPSRSGVTWLGTDAYDVAWDAIVNLTGENLFARRWNERQKAVMRDSRIETTRDLVRRIGEAGSTERPSVLVQASAIGYYGDRGDEELRESSAPGPSDHFLAKMCVDWENAASAAEDHGVRTVRLRIGVVMGPEGGALSQMLLPFRLFVGGPVGHGRQWMSWVHGKDLARLALLAIDDEGLRGPVNGTAPQPETMKGFCSALGRALGRPSWLPVPAFGVRLRFGEVGDVLLESSRVIPEAALAAGFEFEFPDAEPALRDLVG